MSITSGFPPGKDAKIASNSFIMFWAVAFLRAAVSTDPSALEVDTAD
jgi:hypothetical protein